MWGVAAGTETRPPSWDRTQLPPTTLGAWVRSRRRWQRWLLVALAVVWAVGAGIGGWWIALPVQQAAVPSLQTDAVLMLPEAAGLFDADVHEADTYHEGGYSRLRMDVGDDPGQLLVELVTAGGQLPGRVPARPRPELTVEQRYERDRAFLEGQDAYEQWQREVGITPDVPRGPQARGRVHVDREVGCVRLVVSTNDVGELGPARLDALVHAVEESVTGWLEHPDVRRACVLPWRSGRG